MIWLMIFVMAIPPNNYETTQSWLYVAQNYSLSTR